MAVERRVIIVGGGIAGLATAYALAGNVDAVELREAGDCLGGKLRTSAFAGRPAIDEGADAFLARVPHATALAERVGLGGDLTSPTGATAGVWHHRLHPIPEGLLLGVPADLGRLAGSSLLSVRGKLRAGLEPLLPRTDPEDSLGRLIRSRFGDEVHERLVDALVGSIYGADTDRFSLAMVPQLAALAAANRSLLIGARRSRSTSTPPGPLFLAPRDGMGALVTAVASAAEQAGARIGTGTPVTEIAPDGPGWRVDGAPAAAVVLATPARATAPLLTRAAPDAAGRLATMEHAGVVIVTVAVPSWPERLVGRSGYLVPKALQRTVTAASFGSQKWAHWVGDGEVVRVSLGRDGVPVDHLDENELVHRAVTEVGHHLDLDLQPTHVRVSRWPAAFPQYRPHHLTWCRDLRASLPPGLFVTGASYGGIGVPACIAQAEETAADVIARLGWQT